MVCVCVAWDICGVVRGKAGGAGIHYLRSGFYETYDKTTGICLDRYL